MELHIPELSLVVLVGVSGSGKSSFARAHFKPTEVISSDFCRGLVSDDENNQAATADAFELLHFIVAKRLAAGRLTVVDATNVQPESRRALLELARQHHVFAIAIVLNLPASLCQERNNQRPDRNFGPHVVLRQSQELRRSLRGLEREGFRAVHVLSSPEQVAAASIVRERLWNNRSFDHGPFDIIGDIHGCFDELLALLARLGYQVAPQLDQGHMTGYHVSHPEGRRLILLGDLVDRGPNTPEVLKLAMSMVGAGQGLCVPGNHDVKLMKRLRGRDVKIAHGLAESLEQLEREPAELRQQVAKFIDDMVSHYVLDDGKLVVAHAGLKAELQGRSSGAVRSFAMYGETTGESDEFGLPVRYNWAADYRGRAMVVYGHTPVPRPEWLNNTINIDTGCVFGGSLTALRYPERELLSVPAARTYAEPARPFLAPPAETLSAQQQHDHVLDLEDVTGKRIVNTRLQQSVIIREEQSIVALEVMSRFAVNPQWLIYLPPTMSPCATSRQPGLLEHPAEALGYYRDEGIRHVLCEAKHMGSRAVLIVCRDQQAAERRFGVRGEGSGICYTRTGRRFFEDLALEQALVERVRADLDRADLWGALQSDWVCLDCELLPWSAKAQELLRQQYAAVGAAARLALEAAQTAGQSAVSRGVELGGLAERLARRRELAQAYVAAYRRYCWPVRSLDDIKLAPFQILASEDAVHVEKDHLWHMRTLGELCAGSPLLLPTPFLSVDLADPAAQQAAITWWEQLMASGGEGMVVKPLDAIVRGRRGLAQPGIKCRGAEYLRIIYGPEYSEPQQLERLRSRGLAHKRSLALREFALGVEALERFARGEPLRRVHECVFGVLALESEPVDPRL